MYNFTETQGIINPFDIEIKESISSSGIKTGYPDFGTVGYVPETLDFGFPNFNITPPTDQQIFQPTVYLGPAQKSIINTTGLVKDSQGNVLPGASISYTENGLTKGVEANFNGEFNLTLPIHTTLEIRYLGYNPVQISANTGFTEVILQENKEQLDEIVIKSFLNKPKSNNNTLFTILGVAAAVTIVGVAVAKVKKGQKSNSLKAVEVIL